MTLWLALARQPLYGALAYPLARPRTVNLLSAVHMP